MTLRRYNPRRDANEPDIIDALERLGFNVSPVSAPGVPDLICSRRKLWHLVEVKMPKGTPKPAQVKFKDKHSAPIHVIRSVEDAIKLSQVVP